LNAVVPPRSAVTGIVAPDAVIPAAISYNSCRNRHCPKCLTHARDKWLLSARQKELLAVPYVHVVFTLPHTLASLVLHNKKLTYSLLWIHPRRRFFLPVKVLSPVFRGKFLDGLEEAFAKGELCLPGALQALADNKTFRSFLRTLHCHDWVVYAKPPFGGPQHVLNYLARYTHRVAISNHRLVSLADGKVTFRWKDYAHATGRDS